jgi:hypothetical protein
MFSVTVRRLTVGCSHVEARVVFSAAVASVL